MVGVQRKTIKGEGRSSDNDKTHNKKHLSIFICLPRTCHVTYCWILLLFCLNMFSCSLAVSLILNENKGKAKKKRPHATTCPAQTGVSTMCIGSSHSYTLSTKWLIFDFLAGLTLFPSVLMFYIIFPDVDGCSWLQYPVGFGWSVCHC